MWFSAADPKRNKPLTYSLTSSSNDLSTIGITIQKSSRFVREVSLTFLDALLRSDWRSAESLTAWVVKPCKSSSDGWRVSETPQCRTHLEQSGLGALLPSVFNSLPRKARIPTQRKISRSWVAMRSSLWGLIRLNGSHLFWELKLVNMHLPWRGSNLIRVWRAHGHPHERKKTQIISL